MSRTRFLGVSVTGGLGHRVPDTDSRPYRFERTRKGGHAAAPVPRGFGEKIPRESVTLETELGDDGLETLDLTVSNGPGKGRAPIAPSEGRMRFLERC